MCVCARDEKAIKTGKIIKNVIGGALMDVASHAGDVDAWVFAVQMQKCMFDQRRSEIIIKFIDILLKEQWSKALMTTLLMSSTKLDVSREHCGIEM